MAHGANETIPIWLSLRANGTSPGLPFLPLHEDARAEICVVGAGIAGLSVAYQLARSGHRVAVVEAGAGPGQGETGRSTAHCTSAVDDRYTELERLFGADGAQAVAASHGAAIAAIERIVGEEGIDCDFRRLDGYLFNDPSGPMDLTAEAEAARRAGLPCAMVARAPIHGFDTGPAIRFTDQARMDPLAYSHGLAAACARYGVRLFANSPVVSVEGGHPARVSTMQGWHVLADAVVVATNAPINDKVALNAKMAPHRTYAIALAAESDATGDALYWDTLAPYHYVRYGRAGDGSTVLIVGGEDHPTGTPATGDARWSRLENWARARFGGLTETHARWSGQVMEPADLLAFIGHNPMDADNVFIACGDSGNGITHGTIAGLLLSDLVLGRPNDWARLYDPARVTLKAVPAYADANLHVAEHYADWLTGGDVDDIGRIPPGSGAVVRQGLTKLAVYRDECGLVHKCSAVCPHLKCIVAWNDAESSWDCPCHGSRFDRFGRVVNGPAAGPLPAVDE